MKQVGYFVDFDQQFFVGNFGGFVVVGFEDDGDFVVQIGFDIMIEVVVRNIQFVIGKLFEKGGIGFVEYLGKGLFLGDQFVGVFCLEIFVVRFGFCVQCLIGVYFGNCCVFDDFVRWINQLYGFI